MALEQEESMRINSGVNPANTFTTEDEASAQTSPGPQEVPQTMDAPVAPSFEQGKRLEGQLDAFMFRSHLGTARDEAASGVQNAGTPQGAAGASQFLGMRLGVNKYGEEVRVSKEVGSPQGYDNRLQAIAVARMAGADPAAVLQSTDGKWHAVQTNANFAGGLQAAADTPTLAVEGMPSSAKINEVVSHVKDLRAELKDLNRQVGELSVQGKSIPSDLRAKMDRLAEELPQAEKLLGSLVFGVPESEISLNRSTGEDKPDVINIDLPQNMPGAGSEHFDTGNLAGRPTFAISLDRLETPSKASGTLFHESTHIADSKLAQQWLGKFRQEKTGFGTAPNDLKGFQDWIKTPKGGKELQQWLAKQPGLSKADSEVVADAAAGANVSTEARAYVHSTITAMRTGDFDAMKDQLKSYALAIKKGQTTNPLDQSETLKTLTQELRAAFKQMPKDVQDKFRAAVAEAKTVNPNAWISKLDFSK
jgi:hypothetical protein